MSVQSINPYNGKVLATYFIANESIIKNTLEELQKGSETWATWAFSKRALCLKACAENLLTNKQTYATLIATEMGKPLREALSEIEKCANTCNFYAENAENFLSPEFIPTEATQSYIQYQPLGVVLAIMPWNFPFWQLFRFAAPALMAGNTIVLKHASNVSGCAMAIEKIFAELQLPFSIFKTLILPSSEVNQLIANPIIKAVTLTGSEKAGSEVAQQAGKYLKKAVLELGGSDAFIVLADADILETAKMAVKARMINNGQSCIAAKRFIVVEEIAQVFIEAMKQEMKALKIGNPLDENVNYGPMAREDLALELAQQVEISITMGAKAIVGGKKLDTAFFEPTILTNVQKGMPAYHEEFFGPVASIIVVKNEEEAIKVANDTIYGLGASIWTKNSSKAQEMAKFIEAGSVFINEVVKSDPRVPFGGIKHSGYGRELSHLGIREFVNIQTVWVK